MQLSKREQTLTDFLLQRNDYVVASEIAHFADISSKTVYRIVKSINRTSCSGRIIESSRGRGFKINYDNYMKEKSNKKNNFLNCTPLERRNSIILELLFKSPFPVRIENAYKNYFVSDSVIDTDLLMIENMLKNQNIAFSRKGKSMVISGSEVDIRRTINQTIIKMNLLDIDNLHEFTYGFHKLNPYDRDFIISQLEKIERALDSTIPYPYNVNIFSHLYILINRFREGKVTENKNRLLGTEQRQLIQMNEKLYDISKNIISNIGSYLNSELPNIEAIYLLQYLVSTRFDQYEINNIGGSAQVDQISGYYVQSISEREKVNFNFEAVKNDLANHIKPMLNRINNHIYVKNNVLNEIKREYGKLFDEVVKTSAEVEKKFNIRGISEDEDGFIVLYFAKYLEQRSTHQRVLIMCTSGVGTSELLKVKVQKNFRNLDIVDVISTSTYRRNMNKYKNIDLILTTVDVKTPKVIPTLLVSAMFTNKDKERLKALLGEKK